MLRCVVLCYSYPLLSCLVFGENHARINLYIHTYIHSYLFVGVVIVAIVVYYDYCYLFCSGVFACFVLCFLEAGDAGKWNQMEFRMR